MNDTPEFSIPPGQEGAVERKSRLLEEKKQQLAGKLFPRPAVRPKYVPSTEEVNQVSLEKVSRELDQVVTRIFDKYSEEGVVSQYQHLVDALPNRASSILQLRALRAISSSDRGEVNMGMKVFTYLNLKSIYAAAKPFFVGDEYLDAEVLQEGIVAVQAKAKEIDGKNADEIRGEIYQITEAGIKEYIINNAVLSLTPTSSDEEPYTDIHVVSKVMENERKRLIEKILTELKLPEEHKERHARIIRLRFGLEDGRMHTLAEIAEEYGITTERVRQIETRALRALRHPASARQVKDFREEDVEDMEGGYIKFEPRIPIPQIRKG